MRERSAKEKIGRAVELGRNAAMAGDPDFRTNDPRTSLTDTLCNLRHWADSAGVSWYSAMASGDGHYHAEKSDARRERGRGVRDELAERRKGEPGDSAA